MLVTRLPPPLSLSTASGLGVQGGTELCGWVPAGHHTQRVRRGAAAVGDCRALCWRRAQPHPRKHMSAGAMEHAGSHPAIFNRFRVLAGALGSINTNPKLRRLILQCTVALFWGRGALLLCAHASWPASALAVHASLYEEQYASPWACPLHTLGVPCTVVVVCGSSCCSAALGARKPLVVHSSRCFGSNSNDRGRLCCSSVAEQVSQKRWRRRGSRKC